MLCLLLTACWHAVVAGETDLVPTTEYETIVPTASSDPWSPVVGDTEGDLAVNERATGLPDGNYGRRAVFSLVENIRKQLMHDNYDYIYNASGETDSPDVSVTTSVHSTPEGTKSIPINMTTLNNFMVSSYRATHMLPPTPSKSSRIQIQVASVSIPVRSHKGKHIQPLDKSPRFRAFNKESQSPATKMMKNMNNDIVISTKDLLYYMDDSHLSRKHAGMIQRRKFDNSDITITNSTNGNKHYINGKQKFNQQNNSYDSHSERLQITECGFNKSSRRSNRLVNKSKSKKDYVNNRRDVKYADDLPVKKYESGIDNQYDSKDIEYTENVPRHHNNIRRHKEDNVVYDDKNLIAKSWSYSDQNDELQNTQNNDDEENVSAVSQNIKYQSLKRMEKIKNISQTSHENYPDSEHNQFDERQNEQRKIFRRKNVVRKGNKIKHKLINHLDNRQKIDLLRKNNTRHNRKRKMQQNKKMERIAFQFNQFKKHRQQRMHQQKRQQSRLKQKKIIQPKRSQRHQKVVRKKYIKRINKHSRKNNVLGDLYENSYEHEDQNKANDVFENQIDEGYEKMSDTTVKSGNLSDIEENYGQNSQNEDGKNDNIDNDAQIKENHNDNLDDNPQDDTPHDELTKTIDEDEHNIDHLDRDDKHSYIDSIDKEEIEGFNGRRMNNDDKKFTQVNKPDNLCNDSHQCGNQKDAIQNPHDDNQLKGDTPQNAKKYKLLQVPAVGGSRRSNGGERQIIQERDSNGVALYAVDEGPFPQFRLPRDRRQYMDDHIDKRPPLLEISKKSSNGVHPGRSHNRDNH